VRLERTFRALDVDGTARADLKLVGTKKCASFAGPTPLLPQGTSPRPLTSGTWIGQSRRRCFKAPSWTNATRRRRPTQIPRYRIMREPPPERFVSRHKDEAADPGSRCHRSPPEAVSAASCRPRSGGVVRAAGGGNALRGRNERRFPRNEQKKTPEEDPGGRCARRGDGDVGRRAWNTGYAGGLTLADSGFADSGIRCSAIPSVKDELSHALFAFAPSPSLWGVRVESRPMKYREAAILRRLRQRRVDRA